MPVLRQTLDKQKNVFGEDIQIRSVAGPVGRVVGLDRFTSKVNNEDKVIRMFNEKASFPPYVSSASFEGEAFTHDEMDDLREITGKLLYKELERDYDYYNSLSKIKDQKAYGKQMSEFDIEIRKLRDRVRDDVKRDMKYFGLSKEEILDSY